MEVFLQAFIFLQIYCVFVMLWKVFISLVPSVVQRASSQPETNLHLFNVSYVDLVSYVGIYISFPQGFIHQYIYIYIFLHRYIQAFYPHLTTWQYNFKYVLHSCSLVKLICKSKSVSEEILFGGWRIHWGILISFFPVFWSTGPKISAHR